MYEFIADCGRRWIKVRGKDRVQVTNNFFTNQIQGLEDGEGCEGFFPDGKGRIVAHAFVVNAGNELLVNLPGSCAETWVDHILHFVIGEDFVPEILPEPCLVMYRGPVSGAAGTGRQFRAPHITALAELEGLSVLENSWLGSASGFLMPEQATGREKAEAKLSLRSHAEFAADRIFHGVAECGVDYGSTNFPQELDRDDETISFEKGCYLGQETIARLDALGHVNKKIVRFRGLDPQAATWRASRDASLPLEIRQDAKVVARLSSLAIRSDLGVAALAGDPSASGFSRVLEAPLQEVAAIGALRAELAVEAAVLECQMGKLVFSGPLQS